MVWTKCSSIYFAGFPLMGCNFSKPLQCVISVSPEPTCIQMSLNKHQRYWIQMKRVIYYNIAIHKFCPLFLSFAICDFLCRAIFCGSCYWWKCKQKLGSNSLCVVFFLISKNKMCFRIITMYLNKVLQLLLHRKKHSNKILNASACVGEQQNINLL